MSCECNNPTKTTCIPSCVDQICIGDIAEVSSDVYVYIRDVTINKVYRFESSSNGYGNVCLNIDPEDVRFSQDHVYQLFITLQTDGIDDKQDITVGVTTVDCMELVFTRVVNSTDDPQEYVTHTITLDV